MSQSTLDRFAPPSLVALGAILLLAASGCSYKAGGPRQSLDRSTYRSTPHNPQTVSLIDTTKGQTLWTCEIPVGQQLVVRFVNKGTDAPARGIDTMRWALMPINSGRRTLDNEMPCPPSTARRLDGFQRASPEAYPIAVASVLNSELTPGPYTTSAEAAAKAEAEDPTSPAINTAPMPPTRHRPEPTPEVPAPTRAPTPSPIQTPELPQPTPAPSPVPAGDPPVDLPQ